MNLRNQKVVHYLVETHLEVTLHSLEQGLWVEEQHQAPLHLFLSRLPQQYLLQGL
jgi:hypothetical protein